MQPSEDDILTDKLLQGFCVTKSSQSSGHPTHGILYKESPISQCLQQQERRRKWLLQQKEKRDKILTEKRKINQQDDDECEVSVERIEDIADEWMVLGEDEEDEKEEKQHKRRRKYQNILMLSEWMVDVPSDLTSDWFVSICPIAKRCSVIASQGRTRVFARNGYEFMYKFQSALPGGSAKSLSSSSSSNCALDCLYEGRSKTFYILDPLVWNGASFYGTDTPFRDYWLTSRITEELSQVNEYNRYSMKILPRIQCTVEYLTQVINQLTQETSSCAKCGRKEEKTMQMEEDEEEKKSSPKGKMKRLSATLCNCSVDGLLFVHRMTLYTPDINPLANWIKPHMCHQLLGHMISSAKK